MSRINKEDCLIHSQIGDFVSRFNRENIPPKDRYFDFGRWIDDNWRNLSDYCPKCQLVISTQNEKMNKLWNEKEKHRWN